MRVRMLAMAFLVLIGAALPIASSSAQLNCLAPTGYEVQDIQVYSSVNALEEGVIVQIDVKHQFDQSIDAMVRYPYRASVLKLREDNSAALYPSFIIPDLRYTTVRVSVVAVPTEATTESLNIIFSGFDTVVDMAADAAFKGKPLLKMLTGYIAGHISDEALSVLQRGRIVGSMALETTTLSLLGAISADEFTVRVRPVCY